MHGQRHAGISQFLGVHYAPVPKQNRLDCMGVARSTISAGKPKNRLFAFSPYKKDSVECLHRTRYVKIPLCMWQYLEYDSGFYFFVGNSPLITNRREYTTLSILLGNLHSPAILNSITKIFSRISSQYTFNLPSL